MDDRLSRLVQELSAYVNSHHAAIEAAIRGGHDERFPKLETAVISLETVGQAVPFDLSERLRITTEALDRANEARRALAALGRALQPTFDRLGYIPKSDAVRFVATRRERKPVAAGEAQGKLF